MNITTNYRQNPFFTTVLHTISNSMSGYSGKLNADTFQLYTYIIQTVLVSILSCIVCVVCCMCRREDSDFTNGYDSIEYTLLPSSDMPIDTTPDDSTNEYASTVHQQSRRVYSPIQSSSVEPILEPQSLRTTHRVHRVHRTPRKPIPSRHTFAKSIEDLEYMV